MIRSCSPREGAQAISRSPTIVRGVKGAAERAARGGRIGGDGAIGSAAIVRLSWPRRQTRADSLAARSAIWVILTPALEHCGGDDGVSAPEQKGSDVLSPRQAGHPAKWPLAADLLLRAGREAGRRRGRRSCRLSH